MNRAPTLPTSWGSLPPEGPLRLWPGKAGSTAPAGLESRCSTLLEGAGRLPSADVGMVYLHPQRHHFSGKIK